MHLFAIDTSRADRTVWCGVETTGQPIDPRVEHGRNMHDRVLGEGAQAWLAAHPDWRGKLDAVAVVTGPGGFTSLRVGVAFATGLAAALGVPVVPVETPRLLAASVKEGAVWALTRAGGDQVRGQVVSMDAAGRYTEHSRPLEFVPRDLAASSAHSTADAEPAAAPGAPSGTDREPAAARPPAAGYSTTPAGANPAIADLIPGDRPLVPLGEGYERQGEFIHELLGSRRLAAPAHRDPAQALALAARSAFDEVGALSPQQVDVNYGAEFRPTPKP